jgi:hypothetical protein
MATQSNPETTTRNSTTPAKLPPEEKFWERYSPHQEMPLSAVSSLALHGLVIGGLIMLAWLGWLGFKKPAAALPVEPVRFATGGGGGQKGGEGSGKGVGHGAEAVETETKNDQNQQQPTDPEPPRPKLDPTAVAAIPQDVLKDADIKRLVESGNPNLNIFSRVDKSVVSKLRDGLKPGKGQGGTGEGGGKGGGKGMGEGDGVGEGKSATLSQREKRMLRWSMIFDTRTGLDYLHQLRSLGAILAIPTGPDGKTYKIVRDLSGRGPAKLLDEDISSIQRIFWIDDRPESVQAIMQAIHCNLHPTHFVAFMPPALEQELFELEKKYRGLSEDQIHETKFQVVRGGPNGYRPIVASQVGR